MTNLKKIDNQKCILDLFKNFSYHKKIMVSIQYDNVWDWGIMTFNPQKNNEFYISGVNESTTVIFDIGAKIEVRFSIKEIFYSFQTQIINKLDKLTIQSPDVLYVSFQRMIHRVPIAADIEAYVKIDKDRYPLRDINTKGLSLTADRNLFLPGEKIERLAVMIGNELAIYAAGEVKYFNINNDGQYVYGLVFVNLEWLTYQKLFNYIFKKNYPELISLADLTSDELFALYNESYHLSLKSQNNDPLLFQELIAALEPLNNKPELVSNLVYLRNGKLLSIGSVLRLYDRTFLGQPLLLAPSARLNPKAKTNIYVGLAEYILNHPAGEYYLSYIFNDLEWHQEVFSKIDEIIADRDKFQYDQLACFECDFSGIEIKQFPQNFRAEQLNEPVDFLAYTLKYLSPLESACYHYETDSFYLKDIKAIYRTFGYKIGRELWRVLRGGNIVAYVIAEFYPDSLNRFSLINNCKIYLIEENCFPEIIQVILPELATFLKGQQTPKLHIFVKAGAALFKNILIPGLKYRGIIGRIMAHQPGLSEYKKLLMTEFEYYTKYYPLTYPQKGIWYTEKLYPNTSIGNVAGTLRIKGDINYRLLEQAINIFIEKNDAARFQITIKDDEPQQYITQYEYCPIEFYDFSGGDLTEFFKWEEEQTLKPFNLINSRLIYFALVKLSDQEGGFYAKLHHLISDAWTMNTMAKQIINNYTNLKQGGIVNPCQFPSYIDYIFNEEDYKYSEQFNKDRLYWNNKYLTLPEFMNLKPRGTGYTSSRSRRKTFVISKELSTKIIQFCFDNKLSLFTLFSSMLVIYIHRITIKNDIVIGASVLNRANIYEKETAGMFTSTVPLRLNINADLDFKTFIMSVYQEWMALLKHQKYHYEFILKEFRERHRTADNLYDVMLSYQNAKLFESSAREGYSGRWHPYYHQVESLNLHINDREEKGQFIINFDYLVDLFTENEIIQIYNSIINLLDDTLSCPGKKIYQLEMLTAAEKLQLLYGFNDTKMEYPSRKTLSQLFEEQVNNTPHNIAVAIENEQYTYSELNFKSNQLAQFLRAKGVGPNSIIALVLDHSWELAVAIIGVLKAGGAYLPIDPEYPAERINYMLKASNACIILTKQCLRSKITASGEIITLENEAIFQKEVSKIQNINLAADLACLIFTSGSTGNPKGVLIKHYSLVNYVTWRIKKYHLTENDVALQLISVSFDAFGANFYSTLLSGGKLVFLKDNLWKDYNYASAAIARHRVTNISIVPTMYAAILKNAANNALSSLRLVILGGERLAADLAGLSMAQNPGITLVNEYGPTENTITTTALIGVKPDNAILIGKPISNTKVYILDKYYNVVPVGQTGELYVTGAGLSDGYLNNPELTAERFIDNPFEPGTKIYKTGDLARWLPDGNIEFLGRTDRQVKLRGYRIELGEIENWLFKHNQINEAAVIDKDGPDGNKYLWAYYVSDSSITNLELRNYLLERLPGYMVPNFFVRLDHMPLLPNGKIDRKALAEIKSGMDDNKIEYIAPRNELEAKLASIWERVLGVKKIGIDDNFFELGGDSIKAITLINRIQKEIDIEITYPELFNSLTIRDQVERIRGIIKPATSITEVKTTTYFNNLINNYDNFNYISRELGNVFLTGATGFLGIHVLYELLTKTNSHIYCLIRAVDQEAAIQKLKRLFDFYFSGNSLESFAQRVFIVNGDITIERFGLSENDYNQLGKKIDTIIHTAALVKHYGPYEKFYKVNVFGTKQLIDFAKIYEQRLNYISTISVSGDALIKQNKQGLKFCENDFDIGQKYYHNVYVRSKFEAENLIYQAINSGLKAAVYRVGNLTGRFSDGQFQVNIQESMFYNVIKMIIQLQAVPLQLLDWKIDLTPVDYCSNAILTLAKLRESNAKVFHVINFHKITGEWIIKILELLGLKINILSRTSFLSHVRHYIDHLDILKNQDQSFINFLIHELNHERFYDNFYRVNVDSQITQQLLTDLGFTWPELDIAYISRMIKYMINIGFIYSNINRSLKDLAIN